MENFNKEIELLTNVYGGIKGAYLAGGAITSVFTNRPVNDYDIYFKDEKSFIEAVYSAYADGWYCLAQTERAVTFSDNGTVIQFMSFAWFPTAQDIFNKYDFTCVMAAIDLETKELIRHPNFLLDCSKRILNFNHKTDFPLASAMRVKKYQARGYSIENSEYLKILMAVIFTNPTNWESLSNQIGGQYGESLKIEDGVEYTLENAIKYFTEAIGKHDVEIQTTGVFNGAESADDVMVSLFGKEKALVIADKMKEEFKTNSMGLFY